MAKDTVVVIKSINYGEADKILTVFGRELGKFTLFAKSIRKITSKNRGNMQTLSTAQISFFEGKGIPVLTETQFVDMMDFESLDMVNVNRVLFLLNNFLQENDPYPKLFDALQIVLKSNLDIRNVNKLRVKFVKEMGFLQDMKICSRCGSKENVKYFNPKDFALVCENCYSSRDKVLGDDPYGSSVFTESLDHFIKDIVEGT